MRNIVAFCMDSLRYDLFMEADCPNLHGFTDYKRVYSRAANTALSTFSTFMNLPWYNCGEEKFLQDRKAWGWIPKDLWDDGYYTVFLSTNWLLKLYRPVFSVGFDEFIALDEYRHGVKYMVRRVLDTFIKVRGKPKFVFILTMETHQPCFIEGVKTVPKSIRNQLKALEYIDEYFEWFKRLEGTGTEVIVFSDHGDLDPEKEGAWGHGAQLFHPKLFEIPLGRKVL